jgi:hypothetical protein
MSAAKRGLDLFSDPLEQSASDVSAAEKYKQAA